MGMKFLLAKKIKKKRYKDPYKKRYREDQDPEPDSIILLGPDGNTRT